MEASICDSDLLVFANICVLPSLLLRHMVETHHPASPPCHILDSVWSACKVNSFPFLSSSPLSRTVVARISTFHLSQIPEHLESRDSQVIGSQPLLRHRKPLLPEPSYAIWLWPALAKLIVCVGTCRSLYRTHVRHEYPLNKTIL